MFFLAKYATQTTFRFPMNKQGVTDFAQNADWTPAIGDCLITKDGGNVANTTNLPIIVGGGGAAFWQLTLTVAELTAGEVDIQLVDLSSPKVVSDQALIIYLFGNPAAKIPFDLSAAIQPVNLIELLGTPLILNGAGNQNIGM